MASFNANRGSIVSAHLLGQLVSGCSQFGGNVKTSGFGKAMKDGIVDKISRKAWDLRYGERTITFVKRYGSREFVLRLFIYKKAEAIALEADLYKQAIDLRGKRTGSKVQIGKYNSDHFATSADDNPTEYFKPMPIQDLLAMLTVQSPGLLSLVNYYVSLSGTLYINMLSNPNSSRLKALNAYLQ